MADQFCMFHPTAAAPQPVIGWMDNTGSRYANLPPVAAELPAGYLAVDPDQWAAHLADLAAANWTVSAAGALVYAIPEPTARELASAALVAGLAITSTATPLLNGTYGVNAAAQQNVNAIVSYILVNQKFPGSSGTYPWLDQGGMPHQFPDTATFLAFASAIADYVADITMILMTGAGELPPGNTTIP